MTVNSITRECPVCGHAMEVPIPEAHAAGDDTEDEE